MKCGTNNSQVEILWKMTMKENEKKVKEMEVKVG